MPRYAVCAAHGAGTRTAYVPCLVPQEQAALCLWYVRHAGGWHAKPVRTVRRLRNVRVSIGRNEAAHGNTPLEAQGRGEVHGAAVHVVTVVIQPLRVVHAVPVVGVALLWVVTVASPQDESKAAKPHAEGVGADAAAPKRAVHAQQ